MNRFVVACLIAASFTQTRALAEPLSFDLLRKAIETPANKLDSVEAVLAWVSRDYPEYLTSFTLMRQSLSAQDASDENPRAIVFGQDARFILTFNGAPDQRGYDRLEMIQFREGVDGERFEFREVIFPETDLNGVRAKPIISEANPASCMQCHQSPLRPIWEPYDQWPGAYGERDDALIDFDNERYAWRGQAAEVIEFHKAELQAFRSFKQSMNLHARYKWLKLKQDTPTAPYTSQHRSGTHEVRPNLRLTDALTKLQAKKIATQITASDQCRATYADLVLAKLLSCGSRSDLREKSERLEQQAMSQWRTRRQRDGLSADGLPWTRFVGNRPLLEKSTLLRLVGIEATDWSMSREPTHWNYFEGVDYLADFVAEELFSKLRAADSSIGDFPRIHDGYTYRAIDAVADDRYSGYGQGGAGNFYSDAEHKTCSLLLDRAEAALDATAEDYECRSGGGLDAQSVPAPIAMCASCHSGPEREAPEINFFDRQALRQDEPLREKIRARIAPAFGEGRMPPMRKLTDREYRAVLDYLQ